MIQPLLREISSRQPIKYPCDSCIEFTKFEAANNDNEVPVSNQAVPRPNISVLKLPSLRYNLLRSVTSNSPLFEGFKDLAFSKTVSS